jgi:hypothetical protein
LHLCFLIPTINKDAEAGVWATANAKQMKNDAAIGVRVDVEPP